jgi:uncharacterized membrane protein HdeD (DUF308 family)
MVRDERQRLALPVVFGNWWALVLRGLLAVLFGLAALFWPGLTLVVLVYLFAAYALVDGIFAMAASFRPSARHTRGWWLLVEAVMGILTGLVTLFWPGITALVLLYVIAAWFVFTCASRMAAVISHRRGVGNEWLIGLSGVLSIIFGIILAFLPGVGLLSLTWLIGIYALVFGILLIASGFRVRGHEGSEVGRRVT